MTKDEAEGEPTGNGEGQEQPPAPSAPLLAAAIDDRDRRPWHYYHLRRETLIGHLDRLVRESTMENLYADTLRSVIAGMGDERAWGTYNYLLDRRLTDGAELFREVAESIGYDLVSPPERIANPATVEGVESKGLGSAPYWTPEGGHNAIGELQVRVRMLELIILNAVRAGRLKIEGEGFDPECAGDQNEVI